jgi:phosphoglycerate-specific signal transduction histidine kinase
MPTKTMSSLMLEINERLNALDALAAEARAARHLYTDARAQAFLDACADARRAAIFVSPLEVSK